jgi:hypothetical protein
VPIAIPESIRLWREAWGPRVRQEHRLGLRFSVDLFHEERIGLEPVLQWLLQNPNAPVHYAYLRPHQDLGGPTPAKVHFGVSPAHLRAVHLPRDQPGEVVAFPKTEVRFLDPERRLPFLVRQPA